MLVLVVLWPCSGHTGVVGHFLGRAAGAVRVAVHLARVKVPVQVEGGGDARVPMIFWSISADTRLGSSARRPCADAPSWSGTASTEAIRCTETA